MDSQFFINTLFAACGTLGGFILKAVWDGIKELREADSALTDKVQRIEVLVAGAYVTRDDFGKMTTALFTKLDKIDAKLDTKANAADCPAKVHHQ